ncbi:MAG: hypothetical protein IPM40_06910 [Gammaproteobacteria bacterium]|nr:hypothetical protein [Gammaproteobacteria bacterium]
MKQQQFKPLYAAMLSLGLLSGGVAAPVATAAEAGLEEVVVTAQRREENLQETPLSITALGADALTDIRATDIAGISSRSARPRARSSMPWTWSASRCCADRKARSTARTRSAARST